MTDVRTTSPGRRLRRGQRCRVHVADLAGATRLVHESADVLLEAPNWDGDGFLVLNGDGLLWELPADGSAPPRPLDVPGLPAVNNDHVLSPDGRWVYASADDGHVHRVPRRGGTPQRVTRDDGLLHFLHGVSPDGSTLAYVGIDPGAADPWTSGHLRLVEVDGSGDRRLTTAPGPDDGPEYTPDGAWVLYCTEAFTDAPGHAQIARIRPDGSGSQRLTRSERVDWFPHPAPTGTHATYLSYPPGTTGHPADLPVEIRVVAGDAWDRPIVTIPLHGGQGTLNVNGWAPDGTAFAYVDYPTD